MSEQLTNEQIIVNDLVNQLQEKETAIIGYRVTNTVKSTNSWTTSKRRSGRNCKR